MLALLLLLACNPPVPDGTFSSCDPLDEALCALPFPSSHFLRPADTPTGYRLAFAPDSLPVNRDDVPFDPTFWNERDGFSIGGPLLTWFDGVSLEGVIGHDDLGAYEAADAKTVIVDVETGERVPHFVELDMTAQYDSERLLTIRPVVPLDFGRRYVVGIRGLVREGGDPVAVSKAFAALRDDTPTGDWDVEGRRAHFDEVVFPALEAQGFARDELQLAWDFVTASRESTVGRMEWMREDLYERIADGPAYTLTSVEDHDCKEGPIARTVEGEMTVPLYTVTDEPGTLLTRNDAGQPFYNGETRKGFLVRVPCSLKDDPRPGMVLQYGHGLLGSRDEAKTGWLSELADDQGYVVAATDWTGMSEDDVDAIVLMLVFDVSDFAVIPERSLQGYVEQLALTRLVTGPLAEDPALAFDGVPVVDPTRLGYYGNSQGAIMGGALLAMSPDLPRGVLGVGGAPYSMLLTRSVDFDPYFLLFRNKYDDHRETALIITMMQQLWDASESIGWAHDMDKPVLLQVALGDAQVTTLGAHVQARAYGASTVAPETRPVWGVPEREPGFEGSALVEWRYTDVPEAPTVSLPPPSEHDTHECPRREPAGQQQAAEFLESGVVNQHCDGPCEGLRSETCG